MSIIKRIAALVSFILLLSQAAFAHKPSDAYLKLSQTGPDLTGQISINLLDITRVMNIDSDQDSAITWGELKEHEYSVVEYIAQNLKISLDTNTQCQLQFNGMQIESLSDGLYAVLTFSTPCKVMNSLTINYNLLFERDTLHCGILSFSGDNFSSSFVFSPLTTVTVIEPFDASTSQLQNEIIAFFKSGVWHIWIGFDHILFLITLLLPAAFLRKKCLWQAHSKFTPVLVDITTIVTSFTLAHSITLSLVALELINLSPSIVEPLIALSVTAAAVHNLFPVWHARRWVLAFAFGLIHGFGFAGILQEAGIQSDSIATPLIGFNIGVEAGQLAIVVAVLPLIYYGSRLRFYKPIVLTMGSFSAAVIGLLWFFERISG